MEAHMKLAFFALFLIAILSLPLCPIQFNIRGSSLRDGAPIYPVYARKLPFLEWKEVFINPLSREEAEGWIARQRHFDGFLRFEFGEFVRPSTLPTPKA